MTGRSSCPECGTILRIRDRTFVGRRVNCPECKTALRIETAYEDGSYLTRKLAKSELVYSPTPIPSNGGKPDKIAVPAPVRSFVSKWINSPLTAAWLLAIAVIALIAVLTLSPKIRRAPARPSPAPVESPHSTEPKPTPDIATQDDGQAVARPDEVSLVRPADDGTITISALEPANTVGPLPWPPVSVLANHEPKIPKPPEPPKVDVRKQMEFPLTNYKQSKPISRRELLGTLQEILHAPIHYDTDELSAVGLDSTVTFDLENTTVGNVIKTVADGANWEMTIEDSGIRLTKKRTVTE